MPALKLSRRTVYVSEYELLTLAKKLLKILANFIPNAFQILARFPANLNKFDCGSAKVLNRN